VAAFAHVWQPDADGFISAQDTSWSMSKGLPGFIFAAVDLVRRDFHFDAGAAHIDALRCYVVRSPRNQIA
jgi:hypothetical protein